MSDREGEIPSRPTTTSRRCYASCVNSSMIYGRWWSARSTCWPLGA